MANASQLASARATPRLSAVTMVRVVIVLTLLVIWQLMAISGLFYNEVVPTLQKIGAALVKLLSHQDFYWNVWYTVDEIAVGLAIGGVTGVVAGLIVGANPFIGKAFEPYLYYLGPTPKIIFFPVMIMWFGAGAGSKIAMGAVSCFFPIALNVAAPTRGRWPPKSICRRCGTPFSTGFGSAWVSHSSGHCSRKPRFPIAASASW
jgi:NitT/TauT family transport system permease protein